MDLRPSIVAEGEEKSIITSDEPEILFILEIGLILTLGVLGSDVLKKLKIPEILGFILNAGYCCIGEVKMINGLVPKRMFLTKGVGRHKFKLKSFEDALRAFAKGRSS